MNTNQNDNNPLANPDYHPTGVALAAFPGEQSNNPGARKNFNYDNLYHRYPSEPSVDSTINDGSKVQLAHYGGSHVPLAPLN